MIHPSEVLRKFREDQSNDTVEIAKHFLISEAEAYQLLNDALNAERKSRERSKLFALGVQHGRFG